ncbi:MAG: SMP-30/gluconolactonase/LRE family protein [Pseudomonadota bacterium]
MTKPDVTRPDHIELDALRFIGAGLSRPECVLAHASGLLIAPDWTDPGGVSLIAPNGRVTRVLATRPDADIDLPLRPNGIALEPGGTILLTHLGPVRGGVYRLHPDGGCTVVTDRIGDAPMPPTNFVAMGAEGRLWITVSTRMVPRARDYRPDAATGFIAVCEKGETRIAADGLGYTNECLLSADGKRLYVNETFGRRMTVFAVDGARLVCPRLHARFGPGDFPDGMAEAADGTLYVTSLVSNRLLRVRPDGRVERLLEDADPAHLAQVERAFCEGRMGRPHLDGIQAKRLGSISNIAFGGPDLTTAYLGALLSDAIAAVDMPVAGRALPHWQAELGPLANALEAA